MHENMQGKGERMCAYHTASRLHRCPRTRTISGLSACSSLLFQVRLGIPQLALPPDLPLPPRSRCLPRLPPVCVWDVHECCSVRAACVPLFTSIPSSALIVTTRGVSVPAPIPSSGTSPRSSSFSMLHSTSCLPPCGTSSFSFSSCSSSFFRAAAFFSCSFSSSCSSVSVQSGTRACASVEYPHPCPTLAFSSHLRWTTSRLGVCPHHPTPEVDASL